MSRGFVHLRVTPIRKVCVRRTLCLLLAVALASFGWAAKFTTAAFDTRASVAQDGLVTLTETISVRFLERQHGLIRTVPFRTQGRQAARTVRLALVKAEFAAGNGPYRPARTQVTQEGGDWKVRIGEADKWVNGSVRYRLVYTVRGAWTPFAGDDGFGPRDELFWNMTPTAWATPIDKVSGGVTFPEAASGVPIRVLVGPLRTRDGAQIDAGGKLTGNKALIKLGKVSHTEYAWEVLKPMAVGSTTTLVLGMPQGTLQLPPPPAPPSAQPATDTVPPPYPESYDPPPVEPMPANPAGFLFPLAPVALFWYVARDRISRPKTPLVVQFEPPEGVGPSEAGVLIDAGVQQRDIVAGMVSLAQKGCATLVRDVEGESGWTLALKDIGKAQGLTPAEQRLYLALEPFGPDVTPEVLREEFGDSYRALTTGLTDDMAALGWYRTKSQQGPGCGGCLLLLLVIPVSIAALLTLGPSAVLGFVLAAVLGAILVARHSPYSTRGYALKRTCDGLHEFISRAQERELNYMVDRMPDQALFELLLPYAVAFGAVQQWTRAFDGIDLQPPAWVDGYVGDTLWLHTFAHDAETAQSAWEGAVSHFDSGSGFSSGDSGFGGGWSDGGGGFDGGGSAGDGGGGGGGDSW